MIVGSDGLEIEEKLSFLLLFFGINLIDGLREFSQRVSALDHRSDDIINPNLLTLNQVAHRLASTDLESKFQIRLPAYLNQAQQFIDARAFGFKLCLD